MSGNPTNQELATPHGINVFENKTNMERRSSWRLSFVAIFVLTCSLNGGDARGLGTPIPGEPRCEGNISLRLFAKQTVIAVGHSVPLRVEIQNCGQKELWIAIANEENLGFPANLPLIVRDRHRRRVPPNGYSLLGALGKPYQWWIPLRPGYLYGRDVEVNQYHSGFVNAPGKYEVTVAYSGIPRPVPSDRPGRRSTSIPPEDSEVFTGRVESNPIVIEIVAPAADKP
jgi:hypothetical protein